MAKVVSTQFVSIDGVNDDPGKWSMGYFDEAMTKFKQQELWDSEIQLLGRVTYEGFAAVWPTFSDPAGFADRMNSMRKVVVSTTLKDPAWNNTTVISSNVADEIRRLKAAPGGDILIAGSNTLVRFLTEHDLIDEYRFAIHPIIVGAGKRIYDDATPKKGLKLADQSTTSTGIILTTYVPAEIPTGPAPGEI